MAGPGEQGGPERAGEGARRPPPSDVGEPLRPGQPPDGGIQARSQPADGPLDPASAQTPHQAADGAATPPQPPRLGYRAKRRWALVILLIGMPLWIVVAVTVMNALDARFGRQPLLVELSVYIGLGLLWALPFRRIFLGVGQAAPKAPWASASASRARAWAR